MGQWAIFRNPYSKVMRCTARAARAAVLAAVAGVAALAQVASATEARVLSPQDIEVVTRVLQFVTPETTNTATVAILFDPQRPGSQSQADTLAAAVPPRAPDSRISLQAKTMPVTALNLEGVSIALMTPGLTDHHQVISAAAAGRRVITVSGDKACAEAQHCVFSVSTVPYVNLWFSRAAARAAGLRFSPALLMLVKKV